MNYSAEGLIIHYTTDTGTEQMSFHDMTGDGSPSRLRILSSPLILIKNSRDCIAVNLVKQSLCFKLETLFDRDLL